jgi:hypothetical protein
MTGVKDIESAVAQLSAEALDDLRYGRSTALRGRRDETRMP